MLVFIAFCVFWKRAPFKTQLPLQLCFSSCSLANEGGALCHGGEEDLQKTQAWSPVFPGSGLFPNCGVWTLCLWPRRLWVVSMWPWGLVQGLCFCPEILPRQKTLQKKCVSCSFIAVIIPYSRNVTPKPAEWRRLPLHLHEIFVHFHEKSKPGIQKQNNCKYWWTFYVCHSRIVTARTFLVQNIFLSEEGGYFSPKVIDFLGGKPGKYAHFYHYSFE